jgi:hypothetical protein
MSGDSAEPGFSKPRSRWRLLLFLLLLPLLLAGVSFLLLTSSWGLTHWVVPVAVQVAGIPLKVEKTSLQDGILRFEGIALHEKTLTFSARSLEVTPRWWHVFEGPADLVSLKLEKGIVQYHPVPGKKGELEKSAPVSKDSLEWLNKISVDQAEFQFDRLDSLSGLVVIQGDGVTLKVRNLRAGSAASLEVAVRRLSHGLQHGKEINWVEKDASLQGTGTLGLGAGVFPAILEFKAQGGPFPLRDFHGNDTSDIELDLALTAPGPHEWELNRFRLAAVPNKGLEMTASGRGGWDMAGYYYLKGTWDIGGIQAVRKNMVWPAVPDAMKGELDMRLFPDRHRVEIDSCRMTGTRATGETWLKVDHDRPLIVEMKGNELTTEAGKFSVVLNINQPLGFLHITGLDRNLPPGLDSGPIAFQGSVTSQGGSGALEGDWNLAWTDWTASSASGTKGAPFNLVSQGKAFYHVGAGLSRLNATVGLTGASGASLAGFSIANVEGFDGVWKLGGAADMPGMDTVLPMDELTLKRGVITLDGNVRYDPSKKELSSAFGLTGVHLRLRPREGSKTALPDFGGADFVLKASALWNQDGLVLDPATFQLNAGGQPALQAGLKAAWNPAAQTSRIDLQVESLHASVIQPVLAFYGEPMQISAMNLSGSITAETDPEELHLISTLQGDFLANLPAVEGKEGMAFPVREIATTLDLELPHDFSSAGHGKIRLNRIAVKALREDTSPLASVALQKPLELQMIPGKGMMVAGSEKVTLSGNIHELPLRLAGPSLPVAWRPAVEGADFTGSFEVLCAPGSDVSLKMQGFFDDVSLVHPLVRVENLNVSLGAELAFHPPRSLGLRHAEFNVGKDGKPLVLFSMTPADLDLEDIGSLSGLVPMHAEVRLGELLPYLRQDPGARWLLQKSGPLTVESKAMFAAGILQGFSFSGAVADVGVLTRTTTQAVPFEQVDGSFAGEMARTEEGPQWSELKLNLMQKGAGLASLSVKDLQEDPLRRTWRGPLLGSVNLAAFQPFLAGVLEPAQLKAGTLLLNLDSLEVGPGTVSGEGRLDLKQVVLQQGGKPAPAFDAGLAGGWSCALPATSFSADPGMQVSYMTASQAKPGTMKVKRLEWQDAADGPRFYFDAQGTSFDLRPLLAPLKTPPVPPPAAVAASPAPKTTPAATTAQAAPAKPAVPTPDVVLLPAGTAEIALAADRIVLPSAELTKLSIAGLKLKARSVALAPSQLFINGGLVSASVVPGTAPGAFTASFSGEKVPVGPFLELTQIGNPLGMQGTFTGGFNGTGQGFTRDSLLKNLAGTATVGLANTSLEKTVAVQDVLKKVGDILQSPPITQSTVETITGTCILAQGIVTTKNLQVEGSAIKVDVSGSVNAVADSLNLTAQLQLSREAMKNSAFFAKFLKNLGDLKDNWVVLPGSAGITGPMRDPQIQIDTAKLATDIVINFMKDPLQRQFVGEGVVGSLGFVGDVFNTLHIPDFSLFHGLQKVVGGVTGVQVDDPKKKKDGEKDAAPAGTEAPAGAPPAPAPNTPLGPPPGTMPESSK